MHSIPLGSISESVHEVMPRSANVRKKKHIGGSGHGLTHVIAASSKFDDPGAVQG